MGRVTLANAIVALISAKRAANLRPRYIESLRLYLAQFARGREDAPIDGIDVGDVEAWLVGHHTAASTRAGNVGRLSALFAFAERRSWIARNPCRQLEKVRFEPKPPQILKVADAERLLRWAQFQRPMSIAYLALSLFAGVRPEEVERLNWKSVGSDKVVIDAAASKVRRRRIVELHPVAAEWLSVARHATLPFNRMARRRFLRAARAHLGFTAWPQDLLRHSAASYMVALHRDAGKVAYWLGNSPTILMRHYCELVTPEEAERFWKIRP